MNLKPTQRRTKRIACPELQTAQGLMLTQYVVEVSDGKVTKYYPLKKELTFTEWTNSRLDMKADDNGDLTLWNGNEKII